MKRWSLGLGMLLLVLGMILPLATASANTSPSSIQLMLEGEILHPDVPPNLIQGRTLVPIRVVAEGLGAEVGWDERLRKVTIQSDSVTISMQIGLKKATINGKEIAMDVPPMIDRGRTLVPLRFVGESLGITVGWEQETRSVILNQPISLLANGTNLPAAKVYRIGQEVYLPLKEISPFLGATFQTSGQKDLLLFEGLNTDLAQSGKKLWKLKKLDAGWLVPLTVVEQDFAAKVLVHNNEVSIEKIKQVNVLEALKEENGRIILQTSTSQTQLQHFLMESPHRLVIDLPNTVIGESIRETVGFTAGMGVIRKANPVTVLGVTAEDTENGEQLEVPIDDAALIEQQPEISQPKPEEELIKEIRFSQFSVEPQTVRVVVELSQKVKYDIVAAGEAWEVSLEPIPKKEGFLIVIDAGHGGKDPGAKGVSGNWEKDLTLTLSKLLKEELSQYKGIHVLETRTDDTYPTLQERVQLANTIQADLFLSIHANSVKDKPTVRGTETFYNTPQSESFAKLVHAYLVEATKFPNRGTKKGELYVLKHTTMPSALVEIGFLSNAQDNTQMLDPLFQARVAQALGRAINEYYTSYQ
ncbi:N-acetylmuramoyl-L-alanine amidase family protein [Ammoniphilus sp. YIM 78166]|uniref:N-acetylmuramoyl-L-alanine amidase family protein n=1 Tax=Ammoniphilus sp. YIM 78166 TaxID=1644106 RepID=UPI00106FB620|nr:N-acetylmuramoyl-L-alanine amidase family protein [Ammoniphilus sp. YIM 78166]